MKRYKYTLIAASMTFLLGSPLFAEGMKSDKAAGMKHDAAWCDQHCNLKDLEGKVKGLKAQAASADKAATKDHLKKDIETYEKKLQELKKEIESQ